MNILKLISFMKGQAYDPDAQAFFSAAGISNATEKDAVNTLVKDLKSSGLWSKMYAIYPMVGGTTTSCSYNLKNPATYQMSFAGSWTVDSGGILPNSVTDTNYADTGFNLSTNLASQNSASIGVYCTNPSNDISTACGIMGVSNTSFLSGISMLVGINSRNYFVSNSGSNYIEMSGSFTSGTYNGGSYYVTGDGFYVTSRSSSSTFDTFLRGIDYKNLSLPSTSQTMPNKTVYVGAVNPDGATSPSFRSTNKKISFAFIGTGLSSSDADSYFECVQRFNTTLSRQVGIPYYDTYDSDAQTYITTAGLTSFFDKSAANYLVSELKANSLWTKFTAIYPYLGSSTTAQGYNLKNTALYNLSYNTAGGITANTEGLQIVQGASFEYADTGLSDSSLNATNAHIAHWHKNTGYPNNYYMGLYSIALAKGTFLGNSGTYVFQSNNALAGNIQTGLHLAQKPSAGTTEIYNQGTLTTSNSNTDATATGLNLYIGGLNSYGSTQSDGRANGVFNYSSIGESFTSGQNSTYYSIIKTAMRSLGRSSS